MTDLEGLVEGEWNGFMFKFVKPNDHPEIFLFLKKYWYSAQGEIQAKYAGAENDETFIQNFEAMCQYTFSGDALSFIARDVTTNKLVAVRLTCAPIKAAGNVDLCPFESQTSKKVVKVITALEEKEKLFGAYYEIDPVAYFFAASVAVEYRKRGLATEMYRRSIAFLKAKGFQVVKSAFSSPFTRKIVSSMGFVEVARVYLKDFKDENGENDFIGCGDDDYTALMCLKL